MFALFASFSTAGSNLGLALILLASAAVLPQFWQDAHREPVFWLALGLTFYILLRALLALQATPQLDEMQNPHWTHLLRVTGLIALPMGWWLYRFPQHVPAILSTALAGFLIGAAYNADWAHILQKGLYWRSMWGYSPNYLGMISGIASLGVFSWLLSSARVKGWLIGLPLLMISALLLYVSQSRAAWLALPIGLIALAAGTFRLSWRQGWITALSLLATTALIILLIYFFDGGNLVQSRFAAEWNTIASALSGDLKTAAATKDSTGIRIEIWLTGLSAIAEKPIFGWGPGAGMMLLHNKFTGLQFSHFHNLYIESLVSLGLVGFSLIALTVFCFLRAAKQSKQHRLWAPALSAGLIAATSFTAVVLLFEIRIGQTEGRAALTLITALYGAGVFQVAKSRRSDCHSDHRKN